MTDEMFLVPRLVAKLLEYHGPIAFSDHKYYWFNSAYPVDQDWAPVPPDACWITGGDPNRTLDALTRDYLRMAQHALRCPKANAQARALAQRVILCMLGEAS